MHSIIVFHYNSSFVELQAHRLSSCNKMHWQRNSRMSLLNRWGGRSELDSNLLLMCVGQKCTTAYSVSLMWRLLWRTWRTRKTRPLPQTLLPQVIHDRPSLNILLLCYLRQFKCKGLFLKMGQPRPLLLFSFLSNTNFTEKNCRLQWDSNSDRRIGRRPRWPLDHHHCHEKGCLPTAKDIVITIVVHVGDTFYVRL